MGSPEEFKSGAGDPAGIVGFGKCGATGTVADTGSEFFGGDLSNFGGVGEVIENGQGGAKMLGGMRFFERREEPRADRGMRAAQTHNDCGAQEQGGRQKEEISGKCFHESMLTRGSRLAEGVDFLPSMGMERVGSRR